MTKITGKLLIKLLIVIITVCLVLVAVNPGKKTCFHTAFESFQ